METTKTTIDVFWTVQRGDRFAMYFSEKEARDSLIAYQSYKEDSLGWSIERASELVPVVVGEVREWEGGEEISVDDGGDQHVSSYIPIKVMWTCPLCSELHWFDRYKHPIDRSSRVPNPSIACCDNGHGMMLVKW